MINVEANRAIWLVIVSTPAPMKNIVILKACSSTRERLVAVLAAITTTKKINPMIMRRPVLACKSLAPDSSISPAFLVNSCKPAPMTCRSMTRKHAMAMAYLTTEVMMLLVQSDERRSNNRTMRFVSRKFTVNKLTLLLNYLGQLGKPTILNQTASIEKTYPMLSDTNAKKTMAGLMSVLAQTMRKTQIKASARQKQIISAESLSPLPPLVGRLTFFQWIHP